METGYSEEFTVKVGLHQGSVLSPLLFAIVIDEVSKSAREGLPNEILYADDLVLASDSIADLRQRFVKWGKCLTSKGLRVNMKKTKFMVSGTEGEQVSSKIDPCGVCGRRVKYNSVLCTSCGKWVHGRCTKEKRVNARLAQDFVCSKCKREAQGTERWKAYSME